MIVLDSSALVDYLARRTPFSWVESQLLGATSVHAPHLLDVEVVATFRKLEARRLVSTGGAETALATLAGLALVRHGHLPFLERMWGLRANLAATDAAFVALAEALGAPLVTTDLRLARAPGLPIDVVAPV